MEDKYHPINLLKNGQKTEIDHMNEILQRGYIDSFYYYHIFELTSPRYNIKCDSIIRYLLINEINRGKLYFEQTKIKTKN